MNAFLRWLIPDTAVANWTPARAKYYERETLKMLGRGETAYAWSLQFRDSCLQDLGPILKKEIRERTSATEDAATLDLRPIPAIARRK